MHYKFYIGSKIILREIYKIDNKSKIEIYKADIKNNIVCNKFSIFIQWIISEKHLFV